MATALMQPADLGFVHHPGWRPGQWEMVWDIAERIAANPGEVQLLTAPTGFGKSLTYMAIAQLTGLRMGVLTSTKALQDQLSREFADQALVDVRGRAAFECNASLDPRSELRMFFRKGTRYTAATAPCRRGVSCILKDGGCTYFDRLREAARSPLFVANYDAYFYHRPKLGKVDLLVMDEAHQAPEELADYMSFRLTGDDRRALKCTFPQSESTPEWLDWVGYALKRAESLGLEKEDVYLTLSRMDDLLGSGEWVIEHQEKGVVAFDCINADQFGRGYLWGQAKSVLMVSATVNVMTAKALGMDPARVRMWDAPSSFPKERRPVYVVEGAPRLNHRSLEGEKRMWVALADRILTARQDRKGIAHTHSFERAKYLASHSKHQSSMLLNSSHNTLLTVESFRRGSTRGILVSPSMTTGWDFPRKDCEFQIIGKIPFPDLRTKAAKAKHKRNPEWAGYVAAQVIVQASGRGMRSADDQCETFIIDGNFGWWYGKNEKYLPRWWREAIVWVQLSQLPAPPPPLTG